MYLQYEILFMAFSKFPCESNEAVMLQAEMDRIWPMLTAKEQNNARIMSRNIGGRWMEIYGPDGSVVEKVFESWVASMIKIPAGAKVFHDEAP